MDPATALIGWAAKIAGSLLTLREPSACLGWYSLYIGEVVFADCSRERFAGRRNQPAIPCAGTRRSFGMGTIIWERLNWSDITCEVPGAHAFGSNVSIVKR